MRWALRIYDPQLRDEVVVALARAWLHQEPAAARSWLERTELSDAVRSAIGAANGSTGGDGAELAGAR